MISKKNIIFTGGSNKKGTKTDDVLKNIVYVELYNVDMCD